MAYAMKNNQWNEFLLELRKSYRVYAPVLSKGKGKFSDTDVIAYGEVESANDIIWDQKSYFSPKEIFYPIRETLFYFVDGKMEEPEIPEQPVVILLRPCDVNGIERLDRIFLQNGKEVDYYYARRREKIKFIVMECTEGFDSCFCVSMGSNKVDGYQGAVRKDGDGYVLDVLDFALKTKSLENYQKVEFELAFVQENKVKVHLPEVHSVKKEHFDHPMWTEYTNRCIGCGRCNTSCITCSCYSMQDVEYSNDKKMGERRRVWASCHVDGYTNMAGGHGFRNKNGERMRFKTMHKINDFYKRFGEHMCVGCGRCDDVCPEYISFSKCINKLNDIIAQEV